MTGNRAAGSISVSGRRSDLERLVSIEQNKAPLSRPVASLTAGRVIAIPQAGACTAVMDARLGSPLPRPTSPWFAAYVRPFFGITFDTTPSGPLASIVVNARQEASAFHELDHDGGTRTNDSAPRIAVVVSSQRRITRLHL